MKLFKLTLATIFARKVWVIILLLTALTPWIAPRFTPATYNPTLVEPSRIHQAWLIAWLCSLIWGLHQGAHAGHQLVQSRTGEFFQSSGRGKLSQLLQIWLAIACYLIPISLIAFLISGPMTMPEVPAERAFWMLANLQALLLQLLVVLQLLFLTIAIGARFGATVGLIAPALLAFVSMTTIPLVSTDESLQNNPLFFALWKLIPHYDLANLNKMLMFKLGALPTKVFQLSCLYLLSYGVLIFGLSALLFRTHRRPFRLKWQKGATSLVLIGALGALFTSQALAKQGKLETPLNPLGLFGSPLGQTLGLVLHAPADTFHHSGLAHAPKLHTEYFRQQQARVNQAADDIQDIKGLLITLESAKNHRYNPVPVTPEMRRFQLKKTAQLMTRAWQLDPSNPSNYDTMSGFFIMLNELPQQERLVKLKELNQLTLQVAERESFDPAPSLAASLAGATSVIYAMLWKAPEDFIADQHQVTIRYHERALKLLQDRADDGSLAKFPLSKQESFNILFARLQAHIKHHNDFFAREQGPTKSTKPSPPNELSPSPQKQSQ